MEPRLLPEGEGVLHHWVFGQVVVLVEVEALAFLHLGDVVLPHAPRARLLGQQAELGLEVLVLLAVGRPPVAGLLRLLPERVDVLPEVAVLLLLLLDQVRLLLDPELDLEQLQVLHQQHVEEGVQDLSNRSVLDLEFLPVLDDIFGVLGRQLLVLLHVLEVLLFLLQPLQLDAQVDLRPLLLVQLLAQALPVRVLLYQLLPHLLQLVLLPLQLLPQRLQLRVLGLQLLAVLVDGVAQPLVGLRGVLDLVQQQLDLLLLGLPEAGEDGPKLLVGGVVEREGKVDGADFLLVGALLAVGAGRAVVEVLSDAFEVEDVPAV